LTWRCARALTALTLTSHLRLRGGVSAAFLWALLPTRSF